MNRFIYVILVLILGGCSSNDNGKPRENEILLGQWKLVEQLMDPGDGSGTFKPVTSNRTFEFFNDGSVTVNGDMCYITTEINDETTGTFIETHESDWHDGEITPPDCSFEGAKIYYQIEGENLILWYQCIEGCGQKFVKIQTDE